MENDKILKVIAESKTPEEAAAIILSESTGVKAGSSVALVFDETYPESGIKGKVKSVKGGFAEVELPDGRVQNYQVNLLMPV